MIYADNLFRRLTDASASIEAVFQQIPKGRIARLEFEGNRILEAPEQYNMARGKTEDELLERLLAGRKALADKHIQAWNDRNTSEPYRLYLTHRGAMVIETHRRAGKADYVAWEILGACITTNRIKLLGVYLPPIPPKEPSHGQEQAGSC